MLKSTLAALLCLTSVQAWSVEPKPYEALYDVTVDKWRTPNEYTSSGGSILAHVEKTCEAWIRAARFEFNAEGAASKLNIEIVLSSKERLDGTSYEFEIRGMRNGQLASTVAGTAIRETAGNPGEIIVTKPEAKTIPLPPNTLFPAAAGEWVSDEFDKGRKQVEYLVFDGGKLEPIRVFRLLTGVVDLPEPLPDGDALLLQGKAWRVAASRFAFGENAGTPLQTVEETLMPNGIVVRDIQDLGLASFNDILRRVRALPEPKC